MVAADADIAAFLGTGVALVVATRDEDLRAEITRGWGPSLSQDGRELHLCLSAGLDSKTVANLRQNGDIAINLTRPTTYRSVQIKGRMRVLDEPTAAELARADAHLAAFLDEAAQVGVPRTLGQRFAEPPYISVTLAIIELYDQTPGARAGEPL